MRNDADVQCACTLCGQGHYLLGLRILNMLVTEFNQPTAGRTMTQHRKLAVAFRDAGLLKVFQIAIAALQLLQGNAAAADDKLREQVRSVLKTILPCYANVLEGMMVVCCACLWPETLWTSSGHC